MLPCKIQGRIIHSTNGSNDGSGSTSSEKAEPEHNSRTILYDERPCTLGKIHHKSRISRFLTARKRLDQTLSSLGSQTFRGVIYGS